MKSRSGWLIMYCLFAICLGTFGLIDSLFKLNDSLSGENVQSVNQQFQQENVDAAIQEIQQKFQQSSTRWRWINLGLAGVNFILSGLLAWGGIQAFRIRPRGRALLVGVFLAALLFDTLHLIPVSIIRHGDLTIRMQYFSELMNSPAVQGQVSPGSILGIAKTTELTFYTGLMRRSVWALLKAGVYLAGICYLRKPMMKRLFSPLSENRAGDQGPSDAMLGSTKWGL